MSSQESGKQEHDAIAPWLTQAIDCHRRGQLADAASLYDRILTAHPGHFDALQLSGVLAVQTGRFPEAVARFTQALQIEPEHAATFNNRGIALKSLGRLDEAIADYGHAVALQADYPDAWYNLALAQQLAGHLDSAVASYDRLLALQPDHAAAFHSRGIALKALGRPDEALASYERTLALQPTFAEAWCNRGAALHELDRPDEAIASLDRALALHADFPEALNNRGNVHFALGTFAAALADFDRALALRPDDADVSYNRANTLKALDRNEEAIEGYARVLALRPDHAAAWINRSIAEKNLLRLDAAVASLEQALRIAPQDAPAHWNLGICQLMRGNLPEGWSGYEWRWRMPKNSISEHREFDRPRWPDEACGMSPQGKTILLYGEQGFGDTLQFCRYAAAVVRLGAEVILEVQAPLAGLLQKFDDSIRVVARGEPLPPFDMQCPLLSLPLAFGTTLDNIPAPPQLHVDPGKRAEWQARCGARTASRPRIGLAWSGRPTHKNDHHRSLSLATLLPLLETDCDFISLQQEIRTTDLPVLQASGLRHFGAELRDFSDTAALCELMDLVICVDTSIAHLAGTLGKRVRIMLPFCPDWRWLLDRDDSPWYPTAKLYRQQRIGDWSDVVARIRDDLLAEMSGGPQ